MATEAAEAAARLTVHLTQLDALVADYLFYHGAADTPLNGDASEGYSAYKDYLPVLMVRATSTASVSPHART